MSLLTESDARNNTNFSQHLLHRKVEQAATNEALDIQADTNASVARKAYAAKILASPSTAVTEIMPRLVRRTQIATNGGEANDSIIVTEVKAAIAIIAP